MFLQRKRDELASFNGVKHDPKVDSNLIELRERSSIFRLNKPGREPNPRDAALCHDMLSERGLSLWIPPEETALPLLLVRGAIPQENLVAVVGSRSVDPYGLACADEVARLVVDSGFSVLSGGAEGCDARAHRTALERASPTIVVLGHGHDFTYPRHHEELFEKIVRHGGSIVSPFWPTVAPKPWQFRQRNSVIAKLSKAVVVVRARLRSGSLSTAHWAKKSGRPVLAVPSNVGDSYGEGCNQLLADGAIAFNSPMQLRRALGLSTEHAKRWPIHESGSPAPWCMQARTAGRNPSCPPSTTSKPDEGSILKALKLHARLDLDALHMQTGIPASRLTSTLLHLELRGQVGRTESDDYFISSET